MKAKDLWRWQTVSLVMFTIGMLSVGLVVSIDYIWEQQLQDFVIVDAVTDMRKDLTTFHLWLEEYTNGDTTVDLEKNRLVFLGVQDIGKKLLTGGKTQSNFIVKPLDDPALRSQIESINLLLEKFRDVTLLRLRERPLGGSGLQHDQECDRIFNEIISKLGAIEDAVEKDIITTMEAYRKLYRIILIVWIVIISAASIGLGILAKRRRKSEEDLFASEGKYRSLVDSTEDSIYLVDADHKYLFVNKKHLSRLKLSAEQYTGKDYAELHSPEETATFRERVDKVFGTGLSEQYEHKSQRDNRYFLQTFSPVKGPDGRITAVTVVSKNITDRKRMEDELVAMSHTDELTGLYNRRGFFTLAEQQLKLAVRLNRKLYLISADLDDLKTINDTLGHKEGDTALAETADILRQSFRESDIIARIGGDEFVIMPMEMTDDNAEVIRERIAELFEKSNADKKRVFSLSVSTGISFCDPHDPCSLEQMLSQADNSMYEQKRNRKSSHPAK
ncbi:MAG: GGDEF domain-containing protein [Nitrospirae bacterium]|nr:MAG: GGDEF domain-containing protein [Nitrospirota bacterium]